MSAKDWASAEGMAKTLAAQAPAQWRYSAALGDVEFNLGRHDDAVAAYQVAVKGAQEALKLKSAEPQPTRNRLSQIFNNEGLSYVKLGKSAEAAAAFTQAAETSPTPGQAYFNLCVIQYNSGNIDGARSACDKAIAADPARADAYFIKGSVLVGEGKTDRSGRFIAPAGTAETLRKYLELQPNGSHVQDVQAMLEVIGAHIETSYGNRK